MLAAGAAEQVYLGSGQIDGGRHQARARRTSGTRRITSDSPARRTSTSCSEDVESIGIEAEREGQAGLWIEIDHQDPAALLGQRHPDRLHGRRLGDTALLVGNATTLTIVAILGPSLACSRGWRLPAPTRSAVGGLLERHVVHQVAQGDVHVVQVVAPQRAEGCRSPSAEGRPTAGVAVTCSQVAVPDRHWAV